MADSPERPAKMRKLESTEDGNAVPQFAPNNDPVVATDKENIAKMSIDNLINSEPAFQTNIIPEFNMQSETAPSNATTAASADPNAPKMSKSQLKKIRKKAEWEAGREWRKEHKKEKERAKKARLAEEKAALLAQGIVPEPASTKPKPIPIPVPVTLLLDCDFDEYMLDKEIMSLGQQVTRCYSDVKNGRYRANMVISSFGKRMKERYETVLANYHLNWKGVTFSEKHFVEAAKEAHEKMIGRDGGKLVGALAGQLPKKDDDDEKVTNEDSEEQEKVDTPVLGESSLVEKFPKPAEPQLVYLSSDSEHTLTHLSPYTTYIIGGIVDKNRHKGLCHRRAEELGIPTAKLPIGEYMQMQSRTVLATNHVVEIMVNWLESGDWGEAFLKAIPKRKEAVLKKNKNKQQGKDGGADGEVQANEDLNEHDEQRDRADEGVNSSVEIVPKEQNHDEDGDADGCDAQLRLEASRADATPPTIEKN